MHNETREDNTSPTTRACFNLIHKTDGAAVIAGSHDICMHNRRSGIDFWLLYTKKSSMPPSCYFCKNATASDHRPISVVPRNGEWEGKDLNLETLSRKPRLGAGRIRRVKGARPRARARHMVNYRTTSGEMGSDTTFLRSSNGAYEAPLLILNGIRGIARWCNPLRGVRSGPRGAKIDKTASPKAVRVVLRGVRPWNCNLIASPASCFCGSDCGRSAGRLVGRNLHPKLKILSWRPGLADYRSSRIGPRDKFARWCVVR